MSGNKDIQVITFFVFLTLLFVMVSPFNNTPLRPLLGIPLILFVPGYALIAALFPGKSDIDGIERTALSFGLSIAVVPLIGLGLNFTPFGIRLIPILFSLSIFTLIMCLIAYLRRSGLPDNEKFDIPWKEIYISSKSILETKSKIDKVLTLILIFSIIASMIALIYVIVIPKQGEKFTEFYILGENGKAEDYPTQLEIAKKDSVIVGIVNHEYIPVNYTLKILLKNDTLASMPVRLEHNSTWEENVTFIPEKNGEYLKLEFLLYKEKNFTAPYRDLHLWVNVS